MQAASGLSGSEWPAWGRGGDPVPGGWPRRAQSAGSFLDSLLRQHWLTGGLGSGLSWESRPSLSNSPSSSRRLDWVFLHGDRVPRG